jgi:uncharacterized protein YdhG (YjbR/CyaY superfamily)
MQSNAPTVDAYIAEVPADRRAALQEIRRLCKTHLTGFEESMRYGMPGYSRDGTIEVGFASQKNNIALYILRTDVLNPHRDRFSRQMRCDRFSPSAVGKGCIRYANPRKIDFDLIETMLKQTAQSRGPVC